MAVQSAEDRGGPMSRFALCFFALVTTACIETRVIREEVEGPDQENEAGSGLDPECDLSDTGYVVRPIAPDNPQSYNDALPVTLGDQDVELYSFTVHTCRPLQLERIFFEFGVWGWPEEEEAGDPTDPTGLIIGRSNDDGTGWLTRFSNFTLWEKNGEAFGHTPWPNEFRTADSRIAPVFSWEEPRQLAAGEVITLTLTADVRAENPLDMAEVFVLYTGGLIFAGEPDNWGVDLTHTRMIQLNP